MNIRLGTRGSKLALIQSNLVKDVLLRRFPEDTVELVTISTLGDRVTDRPLHQVGTAALFVHEIEQALLENRIDLAVHSMKDLPAVCAPGLVLSRAGVRADPRDVLVSRNGKTLSQLPAGAVLATGSLRRTRLLQRLRPDLTYVDIRGNVDTRLRKLFSPTPEEPQLDALVLAAAGLIRLGRTEVITEFFDPEVLIPAPNQGTLALEVRASDSALKAQLDALGDEQTDLCARAERGFLQELQVDCHQPVGAYATLSERGLSLHAVLGLGESPLAFVRVGPCATPEEAAKAAACEMRRKLGGKVVLVGAGPGDPGLMTVKGLRVLQSADCVVYDRLVSSELLSEAPAPAERLYVGKESGHHPVPQDEINALLVSSAMKHRLVVRLKGGDPFVFGRGGEEALYLREAGIAVEEIPGVTSAIAGLAAAGIPITHRGLAQGFEVTAAHGEPVSHKTQVFLMGLVHLPNLVAEKLKEGLSPDLPAAVIASATLPSQRCVVGTLSTIVGRVSAAELEPPALVVLGNTVSLRKELGFPKSGEKWLVPKIGSAPSPAAERLRSEGAEVDELQVGEIRRLPGVISSAVDWFVVTSKQAIFALPSNTTAQIAAVGASTAKSLEKAGFKVAFVPSEPTSAALVRELRYRLKPTDRVLHLKAANAADSLAELSAFCSYEAANVYVNDPVPLKGPIDLSAYNGVYFTCSSSVERLFSVATGRTHYEAIGPATALTLARFM